jgi:hypothetical protein
LLDDRDEMLAKCDKAQWLGIVHQVKVISPNEFTYTLRDWKELHWESQTESQ